jgi:hypothetical protein
MVGDNAMPQNLPGPGKPRADLALAAISAATAFLIALMPYLTQAVHGVNILDPRILKISDAELKPAVEVAITMMGPARYTAALAAVLIGVIGFLADLATARRRTCTNAHGMGGHRHEPWIEAYLLVGSLAILYVVAGAALVSIASR